MAPTPTPTRQCAWPTQLDGSETIAELLDPDSPACGLADPSYDAHFDPSADPIPVCDVHKPSAQTHGLHVVPAGDTPTDWDPTTRSTSPVLAPRRQTTSHDDVELTTLANIAEAMADLPDNDTRRRVATWVADRYGAPL
jgi:hypothetical protein